MSLTQIIASTRLGPHMTRIIDMHHGTTATSLRLKIERENLTLEQVGGALGVSYKAVSGWLAGAKPHPRRRSQLAAYLSLTPAKMRPAKSRPARRGASTKTKKATAS